MIVLEQYFGVEPKRLVYFLGSVIGTTVIVTLIYCLIFGFDRWSGEISTGSQLMLSAAATPVGQVAGAGMAGQYVCPQHGAVGLPGFDAAGAPHCPVCGSVMNCNTGAGAVGYIAPAAGGGG